MSDKAMRFGGAGMLHTYICVHYAWEQDPRMGTCRRISITSASYHDQRILYQKKAKRPSAHRTCIVYRNCAAMIFNNDLTMSNCARPSPTIILHKCAQNSFPKGSARVSPELQKKPKASLHEQNLHAVCTQWIIFTTLHKSSGALNKPFTERIHLFGTL